ncbi:unnamed protein product, partial [Mesorhabditis spiculigera]
LSEQFKKNYLPEDLQDRMDDLEREYYEGLLTPRVPPGTLDLSEVRNSVYFFS